MSISFLDDFNRVNGAPGNGWSQIINGDGLVISNDALTTAPGSAFGGIFRPIDFSGPVTVSATVTQGNGFDGLLDRYTASLIFGSDGSSAAGYGIDILRGDQTYSDSRVSLRYNGVTIGTVFSTFQFGAQITVTATLSLDGTITGTIAGDGHTFDFSFGPRAISFAGSDLVVATGGPDSRSSVLT